MLTAEQNVSRQAASECKHCSAITVSCAIQLHAPVQADFPDMLGEQAKMLHLYLLWCLLGTGAQGRVSLQPLGYSPCTLQPKRDKLKLRRTAG